MNTSRIQQKTPVFAYAVSLCPPQFGQATLIAVVRPWFPRCYVLDESLVFGRRGLLLARDVFQELKRCK